MKTISQTFDDAETTQDVEQTFARIAEALGAPFTPHFFRVWARSPESLEGIWPVMRHILCGGRVSRRLKEMIFVAISSLKNCDYCQDAHAAFCATIGVANDQIQSLIETHSLDGGDEKDKAAIDFAVKLAQDSHAADQAEIDKLKAAGYDDEEIMELIAMSGMAVFYNHLANATKIMLDQGFKDILADRTTLHDSG